MNVERCGIHHPSFILHRSERTQPMTEEKHNPVKQDDFKSELQVRQVLSRLFYCVVFSSNGHALASGGHDNTVKLWDVKTGKLIHSFEGHTNAVWSVAFSPDGLTLASGSADHTVRLWDVKTGKPIRYLEAHTDAVNNVAFTPDGLILASGSVDKAVIIWRPSFEDEPRVVSFAQPLYYLREISFHPAIPIAKAI